MSQKASLEHLWTSSDEHITGESVLFNSKSQKLYVSCINGQPTEKNGKGQIDIIDKNGQTIEMAWVQGLNAPKGSSILNGRLYVTDIDVLVEIDLRTADILNRYRVEGAAFMNDVDAKDGKVFFSDMKTGKLHLLENGEVSTLLENRAGINGVRIGPDGKLYFLDAQGIHSYVNGLISTINSEMTNGDGLIILGKNEFIMSRWQGEIWYVNSDESILLLDTKELESQTADIGFDPSEKTLYVPTFFKNRVEAYKLSL